MKAIFFQFFILIIMSVASANVLSEEWFRSFSVMSEAVEYAIQHTKDNRVEVDIVPRNVSDGWVINAEPQILILHGDIPIPIVHKYTYTLRHPDWGKFVYEQGTVRATTKTPVLVVRHKSDFTFDKRPTLFVSIPGAFSGFGADKWQVAMQEKIVELVAPERQYKHYQVDWADGDPLKQQIEDLSDIVSDFLSEREYAWDVVLVGHSRGGVFAHEVSKEIDRHSNIHNIYNILLDPTASIISGDRYPKEKPGSNNVQGYNYSDSSGWLNDAGSFGTVSDREIIGYRNELVSDVHHDTFQSSWVESTGSGSMKLTSTIGFLNSSEGVSGDFSSDGATGWEIIKIRTHNINIDGDLNSDNGRLTGHFNIDVGQTSIGFDGFIGNGGVEASSNMLIASSYVALQSDRAEISVSGLSESAAISISEDGVAAHFDVVGILSSDISLSEDEFSVELDLGLDDLQFSTDTDFLTTFLVGGTASRLRKISKSLSGAADNASEVEDFVRSWW